MNTPYKPHIFTPILLNLCSMYGMRGLPDLIHCFNYQWDGASQPMVGHRTLFYVLSASSSIFHSIVSLSLKDRWQLLIQELGFRQAVKPELKGECQCPPQVLGQLQSQGRPCLALWHPPHRWARAQEERGYHLGRQLWITVPIRAPPRGPERQYTQTHVCLLIG